MGDKKADFNVGNYLFYIALLAIFIGALTLGRVFDTTILAIIGVVLVGFMYGKYLRKKGLQMYMILIAFVFLVGYTLGTPLNIGIVILIFILATILSSYLQKNGYL